MTIERKYSVSEIDRMRVAVQYRVIYGMTAKQVEDERKATGPYGDSFDYPPNAEAEKRIEDRLRTYMIAGISPEELEGRE